MTQHIFVLGSHVALSVAELERYVEIDAVDESSSLALGTVKSWPNPRDIPKKQEGLLQDLCGGVIRIGEVLGRYNDWDGLVEAMLQQVPEDAVTPRFRFGISTFGQSSHDIRQELLQIFEKQRSHCRFVNPPKGNMASSRIFDERMIQKGAELLVHFQGDEYILARTVSNQNIRNYTVRDRKKDFRDAHMGMLPPKLAQMMLNIAWAPQDAVIWDSFCGSGTVNIEAILMGYNNYGSDLDADRVNASEKNYAQMGEHFKFDPATAEFFTSDAGKVPRIMRSAEGPLWVVTEGYLGTNFRQDPTPGQIQDSKKIVLQIWKNVFKVWEELGVEGACFCLPHWKTGGRSISIANRVLDFAHNHGYKVVPISRKEPTYVYGREGARVAREIVKVCRDV